MRTHTRYELQDSTSVEDPGGPIGPGGGGTDSPLPGSVGSAPGTSRSVSSESADVPAAPQIAQIVPVQVKPPSPMDTEEEGAAKTARVGSQPT